MEESSKSNLAVEEPQQELKKALDIHKIPFLSWLVILIAFVVAITILSSIFILNSRKLSERTLQQNSSVSPTLTTLICHKQPTPTPVRDWRKEVSKSPNGQRLLTIERREDSKPAPGSSGVNGIINTLSISNVDGSDKKVIYTEVTGPVTSIEKPDNPWSPNGKYFYLIWSTVDFHDLYLFKSDGTKFGENSYLDLNEQMRKSSHYGPNQVINWGKDSVVLSSYNYVDVGPTYRFDIPTVQFTQVLSKNDAETEDDIYNITQEIKNYFNRNCFLPPNLDSVGYGDYFVSKKNPNDGKRYDYVIGTDKRSFTVSGAKDNGTAYKVRTNVN